MLIDYPVIARNISYTRGFKKILDDVSLVFKKNEFVGFLGGSGSGKTTLMTCLNGLKGISSGNIFLNGNKITNKEKIQKIIGYVPQEDIVHKNLTIESALYYSYLLRVDNTISEKEVLNKVHEVINILELSKHRTKRISSLSGGQRKRVNIGTELLHSPMIFFLDEPTAGLDPALENQLMNFLKKLSIDGRVIILSTHLMQNIDLFDIIVFLHEGKIIYFGHPQFLSEYFNIKCMPELFEKVMKYSSLELHKRFIASPIYYDELLKRITICENIQ